MPSAGGILEILDSATESFVFPMLDNGYVYPVASRLGCFAGDDGWALVFETFGYSPRGGLPDLCITSIGEGLLKPETSASFASEEAFANFCRVNEFWRQDYLYPIDDDDWIDHDAMEVMRSDAAAIPVRGRAVARPAAEVLTDIAALGGIGEPHHVTNVARALALTHRAELLATPEERRIRIPADWEELLSLDDWRHPDVVVEANRPSGSVTFQSIAEVLAHRDASLLVEERGNTHWSNWPEGGTL